MRRVLFPRLNKRLQQQAQQMAEKLPRRVPPITDADELASVSQQLKDLLPKQRNRPMRNWLTGFVATTAFKYLVTMVAQFLAVKFGVDEGDTTGLIMQLVAVAMGAWGMYESSKSKIVVDGVKKTIPHDATPSQAKTIATNAIQEAKEAK